MDIIKKIVTLRNLSFVISVFFFFQLLQYFLTGSGGPLLLATRLVPVAIIIFTLNTLRDGKLYPKFGDYVNRAIAFIYVSIAVTVFLYWEFNFDAISIDRAGSYNLTDIIMGALIFFLVMEISRKIHFVLFTVNLVLIVYSLYGYMSPIDFFWHPGTSFTRLITSSSLELATGIYGRYAQMALTLIAAFLLLAAVAKAFGAQSAIISYIYSIFGKKRRNIPQVAVFSSAALGAVSGSGAANTAVTGSFTIPLMKRHGITPVYAGAVETAASMGGLILPPLMAVAGFIMADFLGVPYWEVVLRGFSMAFIYFSAVILSVYLLSVRMIPPETVKPPAVPMYDKLKAYAFFTSIISLVFFLGYFGIGPMTSAVYAAGLLACLLSLIFIYYKYLKREEAFAEDSPFKIVRTIIETHADMTWYMVILMSTLGIMIGLFTVTGFIMRMGSLMLQVGAISVVLTIIIAWLFGWLAGTGLPPTATYIVVAVIVTPPFIQFGIDPWVAHFFVFMVAVWGELSPPTSLTAAVASRLAEASFMKTMFQALKICLPIIIMTFAVFIRTELVTSPGLEQILATYLVSAGTLGFTFAMFGRYFGKWIPDVSLRLLTAGIAFIPLFHPSITLAVIGAVIVTALIAFGIFKHNKVIGLSLPKNSEESPVSS